MKQIIIVILAVTLITTAQAQKIAAEQVPSVVTTAFHAKFPTATKVTWEMENKMEYESKFMLNEAEVSANFDLAGKWIETETEIKSSALPASVQTTIKKEYAGYKIKQASNVENAMHGNGYEVEIQMGEESMDVLFSVEGKVISATENEEDEDREKGEEKKD